MISDEKIKRVAEEFIPHRMTAHGLILADATPDELLLFARAIYEQGRADQREADARLFDLDPSCENFKLIGEAINANTGDITK